MIKSLVLTCILFATLSASVFAAETDVTWTNAVKITAYEVTDNGAPYVKLRYEGNLGSNCALTESTKRVTYVNPSNAARIQNAFVLEAITARNKGMDVQFATNEYSACNADWGLQIFGIKSVSRTE